MLALRYVYVLALSVLFGGTVIMGLIAQPVSDPALHRFFVVSYASGALLLLSLLVMGLLGPRPSRFAIRFGLGALMSASICYAGYQLHRLSRETLVVTLACGLALLFWEALDGTRAV